MIVVFEVVVGAMSTVREAGSTTTAVTAMEAVAEGMVVVMIVGVG